MYIHVVNSIDSKYLYLYYNDILQDLYLYFIKCTLYTYIIYIDFIYICFYVYIMYSDIIYIFIFIHRSEKEIIYLIEK